MATSESFAEMQKRLSQRSCVNCVHLRMCKMFHSMNATIPQLFPEARDGQGKLDLKKLPVIPDNLAIICSEFVSLVKQGVEGDASLV